MQKPRLAAILVGTLSLAGNAYAQQGATVETWANPILTLTSPQQLADAPFMLGNPTSTTTAASYETPANIAGPSVRRIRSKIVVPTTGNYAFSLASNGFGMVWIHSSQVIKGRTPNAKMMQAAAPTRNQWTKFAEQTSATMALTAGQTIYVTQICLDYTVESGTNANHCSLRWQLPSSAFEGPIPASRMTVPPGLVPVVTLSANPNVIAPGNITTLTWSSQGATGCTATGGWAGSKPMSGSVVMTPAASITYMLQCSNTAGSTIATAPVIVQSGPLPTVNLMASPPAVNPGNPAALNWNSTNATSCTATGGWSGGLSLSGTMNVFPNTTTTYNLTCTGPGGTVTKSVTVTVSALPPATLSFSASSVSVPVNSTTTLTWNAANVTGGCTASSNPFHPSWNGSIAVSGSRTITMTYPTVFTMNCIGTGGSVIQSIAVNAFTPTPPTLAWDPPDTTLIVMAYIVSYGPAPRSYTNVFSVGTSLTWLIEGVGTGNKCFTVQADYGASGISAYANEVCVVF